MNLRAALLSVATLVGISLWGLAVYTEGVAAGHVPHDGYGVSISPIIETTVTPTLAPG